MGQSQTKQIQSKCGTAPGKRSISDRESLLVADSNKDHYLHCFHWELNNIERVRAKGPKLREYMVLKIMTVNDHSYQRLARMNGFCFSVNLIQDKEQINWSVAS